MKNWPKPLPFRVNKRCKSDLKRQNLKHVNPPLTAVELTREANDAVFTEATARAARDAARAAPSRTTRGEPSGETRRMTSIA